MLPYMYVCMYATDTCNNIIMMIMTIITKYLLETHLMRRLAYIIVRKRSLGVRLFDEFASPVYRVGCTECNGTSFKSKACFN